MERQMVQLTPENRGYHKKRLKRFWIHPWVPGRTPEIWEKYLNYNSLSPYRDSKPWVLIHDCIVKLILEKRLQQDQANNISRMLHASDRESQVLALSLLQAVKPNKFWRRGEKVDPGPT